MDDKLKKIIMIATSLGAFIVPFMVSSINIALPTISKEFLLSSVLLNWIALSFTLATAIFILPFGRLADILGRKKLLLLGMTAFTLASILCGISFNPAMLILSRTLQGISGATISVTVVSILTSVFPAGARGKALGLNVAMTYTGLSTGPYLGGLLTKYFGWRSIFFVSAFIGVAVVISLINLKQEWVEAKGEKFDFIGSVIYGISLLGIILGFSLIRSTFGPILIAIGILAMILFGYYENKTAHPILNMSLFKNNKVVTFSSLAALINYSATFALSYLLSLYLQYIKGFEPTKAGLILIAQPIVMTLFSPVAGFFSDKIEPQRVASIGMALTTVGLSFFIFLNETTSIPYIITALLIMGFGFALFSSPNTNAVMSSVEKKYYGITSGILGASRTVGQTLSMGLASLVLAIYIGNAPINSTNVISLL
ncbi:MAG: putative transport protein, partial [Bacillota bacterium]|nr:putative transport protein [Bacillota bacterium]